ncbi:hypothetical protein AND_003523 [Anopheles darlingi]|uniref:Fibrinogen C-terminal domain-containing protein n=1 Tax=Anopheles darlingi TaxID=43151 RepID=W5JPA4_ANODA|nr:hypothetical protein AND_003523 [Anopheles darlingi]
MNESNDIRMKICILRTTVLFEVDEKLQSMEDNLKSMEDKMQKSEIKMLQEHRNRSQTKNHKETFAAIKKLERQFARNLSEVHNRNQENINAVLHKLDKDIGSVLHNQYRIPYATSCKGVPSNVSGTYLLRIKSASEPFEVYCEQNAFDGGWIVMQFRFDGSLDFYRGWNEFRDGFGDLRKEFWLGLEKVHQITRGRKHELIVELKDFSRAYVYARYDAFEIGSESERYKLKDIGKYNGTAGDEMINYMGMKFSTKDRDNDAWNTVHCAQEREARRLSTPLATVLVSQFMDKIRYRDHLENSEEIEDLDVIEPSGENWNNFMIMLPIAGWLLSSKHPRDVWVMGLRDFNHLAMNGKLQSQQFNRKLGGAEMPAHTTDDGRSGVSSHAIHFIFAHHHRHPHRGLDELFQFVSLLVLLRVFSSGFAPLPPGLISTP